MTKVSESAQDVSEDRINRSEVIGLLVAFGKYEQALPYYEEFDSQKELLYSDLPYYCVSYFETGQFDRAYVILERYLNAILCLDNSLPYEDFVKDLNWLLKYEPRSVEVDGPDGQCLKDIIPESLRALADALICFYDEYSKDQEAAMHKLAKYCVTENSHHIQSDILSLFKHELAAFYDKNKRYAESQRLLEEILHENGDLDEGYYNLLGIALYKQENYVRASEAFTQASRKDRSDITLHRNCIHAYKKAGMCDEVLQASLNMHRAQKWNLSVGLRDFPTPAILKSSTKRPQAPILMEASFDVKLKPENDFQLIEPNNMYSSTFNGFERLTGKNMREDIVFPNHDKIVERFLAQRQNVEIIKQGKGGGGLNYLCRSALDNDPTHIYTSGTLQWHSFNEYKDYMHLTTPRNWAHAFPKTIVMPRTPVNESTIKHRLHNKFGTFDNESLFIIKPCNDSIGRGVEVVSGRDIIEQIHQIASWNAPPGNYWHDHIYPNFLVQECVRGKNVVADNGETYDGTMRIAFTAIMAPDRRSVQSIDFHPAYWKLPSKPCHDSDTRNSIVSFPPSEWTKITDQALADSIPVSAPVSDDDYNAVVSQLTPYLKQMLPRYSGSVSQTADQITRFVFGREHARQALGFELATDFTCATTIGTVLGAQREEELMKILNATPVPGSAHEIYKDYLCNDPIETTDHAAAIGNRCESLAASRTPYSEDTIVLEDGKMITHDCVYLNPNAMGIEVTDVSF